MEKEAKTAVTPNIKNHVHKLLAYQQTPDEARKQASTRVNEQTTNLLWGMPGIHKMEPGSAQDLGENDNQLTFQGEEQHNTVDAVPGRENLMTDPEHAQEPEVNDYLQEVDVDGENIAPRPQQLDTISKNCLSLAARSMLSPKAGEIPKKLNSHRLAMFENDKLIKKQQ